MVITHGITHYKDFSHHYKAHARATVGLVLLSLVMAGVVWYL